VALILHRRCHGLNRGSSKLSVSKHNRSELERSVKTDSPLQPLPAFDSMSSVLVDAILYNWAFL
jgi:hypothetical protein